MNAQSVVALFLACIAVGSVNVRAQNTSSQNTPPAPIPTLVVYKNPQYGFCFPLPADWKGYNIISETWSGTVLDTQDGHVLDTHKKESGPQLLIRNPKWTKDDPWQDIPIMIFTPSQWKLAEAGNLAVSAAPIGPAKLGENKNYIFALPPRWIGFTDAEGQDELMTLIYQNPNPFEAPCGHKSTRPIEHLP